MAFPAIANSQQANGVSQAAVTKPTGLTVGDLMIAWAVSGDETNGNSGGPSAPDGTWTALQSGGVSNVGSASWWKFATSTDVAASSFTFSCPSNSNASRILASVTRITGVHPTAPINGSNHTSSNGNSLSTPGITPTTQCLLLILVAGTRGTSSGPTSASVQAIAANNPSWTAVFNTNSAGGTTGFEHVALSMVYANQIGAPNVATGNATATLDGNVSYNDIQILAIAPPITVQASAVPVSSVMSIVTFLRFIAPTAISILSSGPAGIASEVKNKWHNVSRTARDWHNDFTKSP